MAKVLLYCPTYRLRYGGLAIRSETRASISSLAFDGQLERLIVDDNPYRSGDTRNVLHQYRRAREMALEGAYDALLTFEHDVIAPEDGLQKLWDAGAPVAYGLYCFRHHKPIVNALRFVDGPYPDMSLSNWPDEIEKAWDAKVVDVTGLGFGFTLIRRGVLESIPFRGSNDHAAPDIPFAQDCMRLGVRQVCRFDVVCGHIRPDGKVLYPERKNGQMNSVKVLILKDFIAPGNRKFSVDQETSMDAEEANEYERCGFLRVLGRPAVKVMSKPERVSKAVKAS